LLTSIAPNGRRRQGRDDNGHFHEVFRANGRLAFAVGLACDVGGVVANPNLAFAAFALLLVGERLLLGSRAGRGEHFNPHFSRRGEFCQGFGDVGDDAFRGLDALGLGAVEEA
jgi:hypothetical protein